MIAFRFGFLGYVWIGGKGWDGMGWDGMLLCSIVWVG